MSNGDTYTTPTVGDLKREWKPVDRVARLGITAPEWPEEATGGEVKRLADVKRRYEQQVSEQQQRQTRWEGRLRLLQSEQDKATPDEADFARLAASAAETVVLERALGFLRPELRAVQQDRDHADHQLGSAWSRVRAILTALRGGQPVTVGQERGYSIPMQEEEMVTQLRFLLGTEAVPPPR